MSSCWDHVFNAFLYDVAEEEGLSIMRVGLNGGRKK
jgi:hypothetical protein